MQARLHSIELLAYAFSLPSNATSPLGSVCAAHYTFE